MVVVVVVVVLLLVVMLLEGDDQRYLKTKFLYPCARAHPKIAKTSYTHFDHFVKCALLLWSNQLPVLV